MSIMSIIYGLALFSEINEASSFLKIKHLSKDFLYTYWLFRVSALFVCNIRALL